MMVEAKYVDYYTAKAGLLPLNSDWNSILPGRDGKESLS
jgi:hypothetical protein